MIISILWVSGWYFLSSWYALLYFAVITPHILILTSHYSMANANQSIVKIFIEQIKDSFNTWFIYAPVSLSIIALFYVIWNLYQSEVGQFIADYILWHEFFGSYWTNSLVLQNIFLLLALLTAFVMGYIWLLYTHYSHICKVQSVDLQERFTALKERLDPDR